MRYNNPSGHREIGQTSVAIPPAPTHRLTAVRLGKTVTPFYQTLVNTHLHRREALLLVTVFVESLKHYRLTSINPRTGRLAQAWLFEHAWTVTSLANGSIHKVPRLLCDRRAGRRGLAARSLSIKASWNLHGIEARIVADN